MISRRSAVSASIGLPLALLPVQSVGASDINTELEEARRVVFAFFEAMNSSNWAFVDRALNHSTNAQTNDTAWLTWASSNKDPEVLVRLKDGPQGSLFGSEEVIQFLKLRHQDAGWRWHLPRGLNSIWSPAFGMCCAYSEWERTDGGSYGRVYPTNPTFFHRFHFTRVSEFGATVSRQIDWMQEVSLRNVVYG